MAKHTLTNQLFSYKEENFPAWCSAILPQGVLSPNQQSPLRNGTSSALVQLNAHAAKALFAYMSGEKAMQGRADFYNSQQHIHDEFYRKHPYIDCVDRSYTGMCEPIPVKTVWGDMVDAAVTYVKAKAGRDADEPAVDAASVTECRVTVRKAANPASTGHADAAMPEISICTDNDEESLPGCGKKGANQPDSQNPAMPEAQQAKRTGSAEEQAFAEAAETIHTPTPVFGKSPVPPGGNAN